MAETRTPRLSLPSYSAGTDAFSRLDWQDLVNSLEANAAADVQDTLANRPPAGIRGRYFYATDNGGLYRDTGTVWVELNPARSIGGATPAAEAIGDTGAEGASTAAARRDHRHAMPGFGNVTASTIPGIAAANGAAATVARSDHVHGTPDVATPGASAVGDTAAQGVASTLARSDHRHAREAFSASTPAAANPGTAGAAGASSSPARADHAHAVPAYGSPASSAPGDATADGASATFARADHKHAREAFAASAATVPAGGAGTAGAAGTVSRGDHVHPLASGVPGASAIGDSAAEGASASVARLDHRHARESATAIANAVIPAGVIVPFGGGVVPAGWLLCDGAEVSSTTYPALASALGATWGAAAAGNTKLPDLRGRFALGKAASGTGATLGGYLGSLNHTHTVPAHGHGAGTLSAGSGGSHDHTIPGGNVFPFSSGQVENQRIPDSGSTSNGVYVTYTAIDAGGAHTHSVSGRAGINTAGDSTMTSGSNNPPAGVVNYIIKAH